MIINGKEAKFFWGSTAFIIYQEAVIKSSSKLRVLSVPSIASILWGGILNHHERLLEECPFNYTELYDYVEAIAVTGELNEEISSCIKGFNDSVYVQNAVKVVEEDVKKNSIPKSSKKQHLKQA